MSRPPMPLPQELHKALPTRLGDSALRPTEEAGEGLQSFVAHAQSLSENAGFDREYLLLRDEQAAYRQHTPQEAGLALHNMRKNRYRDIIPYDHARVVLPSEKGDEGDEMVGSDYVNASYVYNAEGAVSAVAAQGPLPHTTDDFWRMVFHVRARVIVMVCNVIEKDRFKCAKYWPDMGETEEVGALEVKALSEENKGNGIILRKFQLRQPKGETRDISQYHYTAWPDHGVPDSPHSLMSMLGMIRDEQPTNDVPLVIHCSAGVGRTGTICAIDSTWELLKKHGLYAPQFDIFGTVSLLRRQRVAMVQTKDQYVIVYKAILDLVQELLSAMKDEQPEQTPPAPTPSGQTTDLDEALPPITVPYTDSYVNKEFARRVSMKLPEQRRRTLTMLKMPNVDAALKPHNAGAEDPPKAAAASRRAQEEEEEEDEEAYLDEERTPLSRAEPAPVGGALGFPNRIAKPKGSRPIPAGWGQPWNRTELIIHVV